LFSKVGFAFFKCSVGEEDHVRRPSTMPAHSRFQEKIDVLDLIIDVLRDHEEKLSRSIGKFDEVHQGMYDFVEKLKILDKILERLEGLKVKNVVKATGINGPLAKVACNDWATFQAASRGALLVTFEVSEGQVTISSITDLFVFTYSDGIIELMGMIGEGAIRWIREALKNGESGFFAKDILCKSRFLFPKIRHFSHFFPLKVKRQIVISSLS